MRPFVILVEHSYIYIYIYIYIYNCVCVRARLSVYTYDTMGKTPRVDFIICHTVERREHCNTQNYYSVLAGTKLPDA